MGVTMTTIRINSNDLGADATLVLVFDVDDKHEAYKDLYPFVIRADTFLAKDVNGAHPQGNYAITLPFINQLSFVKPEENLRHPGNGDEDDHDVLKNFEGSAPATWVEMNPGQLTTLTESKKGYAFSDPTAMESPSPNDIRATNQCSLRKDIVLGYRNPKGKKLPPQSVWSFPKVADGANVTAQFKPIVQAYIAEGYWNNQLVKEPFPTQPIWKQDLRALANTTDFMLTYDPSSGVFIIKPYVA